MKNFQTNLIRIGFVIKTSLESNSNHGPINSNISYVILTHSNTGFVRIFFTKPTILSKHSKRKSQEKLPQKPL